MSDLLTAVFSILDRILKMALRFSFTAVKGCLPFLGSRDQTYVLSNLFKANSANRRSCYVKSFNTKTHFKPEGVIFDKDGTLVCFHTMWSGWCEDLVERVNLETRQDLSKVLFNLLGYDSEKREVRLGIVAELTNPFVRSKVLEMLVLQGFSDVRAREVVDRTWKDKQDVLQIKVLGNLVELFQRYLSISFCNFENSLLPHFNSRLKANGMRVAICTSDSRESTLEFVERVGISSLVDMIVCGDDQVSKSKPDPHNVLYICEKFGISTDKTVMVGDTPADTVMGKAAGVGLNVGVLSGVGEPEDLKDANLLVEDITALVDLLTSDNLPKAG